MYESVNGSGPAGNCTSQDQLSKPPSQNVFTGMSVENRAAGGPNCNPEFHSAPNGGLNGSDVKSSGHGDGMLQILNAINKTGNNSQQPLHLDRTDINVVVDESFCVKGAGGQQRWQCNVCPKYYATKNHLVTHLLGHYGVKPFACTICNKTFNQATRLKFHMLSHNKGKHRYTCSVCLRSFAQVMHLRRHLLTHENKQPYSCHSCAKGFALLGELHSHLELHKREQQQQQQPHQNMSNDDFAAFRPKDEGGPEDNPLLVPSGKLRCDICGRKFLFPSQMKDHMLTHTQVRRYECAICKMKFLKVHHLKAHCLTHTNIRPHKCDMCGRSFTLKGNLIRHLLTHTKERAFECDICGKRFSQRQTLKTHLVIHADNKPFSCEVCGKALSRAHNLKSHMALHRHEKPFKCPLCNSAFTMKGNLHRHYKEKHKEAIKTTLNLDTQKTGMALVLSNQYLGSSNRGPRMDKDPQLENMFNFGVYSQAELGTSRKRKRSPKKRSAKARHVGQQLPQPLQMQQQDHMLQQQQVASPMVHNLTNVPLGFPGNGPPPTSGGVVEGQGGKVTHTPNASTCSFANSFHNSVLNYYCNDSSCACKFQGQIGYSQHLIHKLHSLHSAIDSLAVNSGHGSGEKVNAIHMAIDEMATSSTQKLANTNNFC